MDTVKSIVNILKSRKYNRHKVNDINLLSKHISSFVKKNEPIKIVGYWGITNKKNIDKKDKETIKFLNEIINRVKKIYDNGINFTFIISDSHALMNGYNHEEFKDYINNLITIINHQDNINFLILSELRKKYNLNSFDDINFNPDKDLHNLLLKGAERLFNGNPKVGSEIYYKTRIQEIDLIEKTFPNYLFFTYNHPKCKEFLPDMPLLFLYSRKGTSIPPWLN